MQDEEIIEAMLHNNEKGLEELELKYGKQMSQLAFNILQNRSDAEECVADAYLKLWKMVPLTRPDNLKAYALKTVRNICISRIQLIGYHNRNMELSLDEAGETAVRGEEDISEELALKEIIQGFLEELDKEKRQIFLEKYWFGESEKTIAAKMNISVSKVKIVLFRCRRKLKKNLDGNDI